MDILILKISENLPFVDKSNLSTKFGSPKKNIEYSLGRMLVTLGAKKIFDIKNFEIDETNKKPIIKNNLFQFSISHSNDIVAVGFSKEKIGIDIEKIVPRNYEKIAKRLNFKCNTLEEFYTLWTQYEAKFKSGLKTAQSLKIKDYMFSVSSENYDRIKIYEVDLQHEKIKIVQ